MIVTVSAAIERQAPYADKQIGVRLFRVLVRVVTYIRWYKNRIVYIAARKRF